ncbi:Platelet-activating factor acetylhydrolase [Actinoplanes sp. SE50]|uniref:alpha/beta hydrolase family protein n=1 Tax=unclassified Actinoplanes TaxID=2626549 RepID=UPI00023EC609|nr:MULTISPECIES: Platelet-activating factor acetylhydrolase [unclassified Actinoplanes]AEV84186.1 Platelet-activating factor acetylhydrolase [Actinoplanes sp. SE50/110]ATO82578.1 Platelet-activating factor acetylhydrolase [Actinoplanes sp. SE50]SLL99985.1 Platelet-activating factor acetylhydrolase [Actinoplanes sp. SE50/110]
MGISRRGLLGATLAAGISVPFGGVANAAVSSGPPRLRLPRPTGPLPVGTTRLHLVDRSRTHQGRPRELMANIWYPAEGSRPGPVETWLDAEPMRLLLASADFDRDAVLAPFTSGRLGAPVRRTPQGFPVVVYSHGAHDHRSETTIIAQELVSHGFVVATVDHTFDAYTEFPDGRVLEPVEDPLMLPLDFARDAGFVIDQLEVVARGGNPDVDGRPLPDGLGRAIDVRRIGMYGHSKGGTATALLMAADRRVRAGLILDGPMESDPMPSTDLDRPVLLMSAFFNRADHPAVAAFWSHLRGWRLTIRADGAAHPSYTDYQTLYAQVAPIVGLSDEMLQGEIGTLDPGRAVRIQQAYPLAFFDQHLRGRHSRLLDGPSRAFPEVRFLP